MPSSLLSECMTSISCVLTTRLEGLDMSAIPEIEVEHGRGNEVNCTTSCKVLTSSYTAEGGVEA